MKGMITTIQRMSIHDGPGIRSVVFFKGCNLRCKWCHNPETWSPKLQLQYVSSKCICCGICVDNCNSGALRLEEGRVVVDRDRCILCKQCVNLCPTEAITAVGREVEACELMTELLLDKPFFENSGGGVTLSGGEPLLQSEFALELLKLCKHSGLHTGVESNFTAPWSIIEKFIPYVDMWMCDLKLSDSKKHKSWVGINNDIILSNIKNFAELNIPLIVRTPVIPNVNDNRESIGAICDILSKYENVISYELLEFHSLGFEKFEMLGMKNELSDIKFSPKGRIDELRELSRTYF